MIFKVIGDVHPDGHYLGCVKYHLCSRGDRQLFGRVYRQNAVVPKSFGVLAGRPECYAYSPVLGCVITGLPRHDIVAHYSCRQALVEIHDDPSRVQGVRAGDDLLAVLEKIVKNGAGDLFGVTGSFLVGCFNAQSDIDLVCYGRTGYEAARELFADTSLIRPYAGDGLMQLYLRRAKYLTGSSFDARIRQEQRKLQGRTAHAGVHINCEPLRADGDRAFARMYAKEIGEMTLLAVVTEHEQGLATPALHRIGVRNIRGSTVDDPEDFASRITYLRSYLGAYTGAFRAGDTVHISGKLVYLHDADDSGFGIELTPWSVSRSYPASLTDPVRPTAGHTIDS